ncbi:hypothetical protein MKW98_003865 [Papaver atlanticum]|uniref:GOLD domain-containing protein n=1 Tax=Papaver atlanticum TaxID=357466 RepID=A0AAD4XCM8_9MAGN|nr:hypothetical protein MKW98_003865 [Papaver atlanticum]
MIKAEGWHYGEDGADLVVKGTTEEQSHDARDKTSEKFEFVAHKKGVHKFCFTNKSPYHETLDFDIHVGHFTYFELYAKDEHFNPLLEQISKLKEALYNIQLEQHWLEATTDLGLGLHLTFYLLQSLLQGLFSGSHSSAAWCLLIYFLDVTVIHFECSYINNNYSFFYIYCSYFYLF